MSFKFQVPGCEVGQPGTWNHEPLISTYSTRRYFAWTCVKVGKVLLHLAHDTCRRQIEAVAPHCLRAVVHKQVGHGDAANLRLGDVVMCVVKFNYRITEAARQRALFNGYHTAEVVGDVGQQFLVYRLGKASIDDGCLDPVLRQYIGGLDCVIHGITVGDYRYIAAAAQHFGLAYWQGLQFLVHLYPEPITTREAESYWPIMLDGGEEHMLKLILVLRGHKHHVRYGPQE